MLTRQQRPRFTVSRATASPSPCKNKLDALRPTRDVGRSARPTPHVKRYLSYNIRSTVQFQITRKIYPSDID